jgi:hypothetical protein
MIRRVRDEEEMEYDIEMGEGKAGGSAKPRLKRFDPTSPPDLNVESPADLSITSPPDLADVDTEDELPMPALKAMSLEEPKPKAPPKRKKK